MEKIYVQYGCGLSAPKEWKNFDVSPTLRIQKTPVLGSLLKGSLDTVFPSNVMFGDITKGLPIKDNSCDGVYCSHTLEHIALDDFRKALRNTYKILKKGGIFRCIVPDIEWGAKKYIEELEKGNPSASLDFIKYTHLGLADRARGLKGLLKSFYGNSRHLWMWDEKSLIKELSEAGFINMRACKYNDSKDEMFKFVEDEGRFINAVAIECSK